MCGQNEISQGEYGANSSKLYYLVTVEYVICVATSVSYTF